MLYRYPCHMVIKFIILIAFLYMSGGEIHAQSTIGGPYEPDSATVVLMHFDQNFDNEHDPIYEIAQPNTFGNISFLEMDGAGDLGYQVRFDNDSPDDKSHIQIPDTAALDLTGNWTIEYWMNTFTFGEVLSPDDWRYHQTPLIKPGDGSPTNGQDYARANYYMRTPLGNGKFIAGYHSQLSDKWIDITSPNLLHVGEWYHVTFIRDTSKQVIIQMLHQNAEDPGRLPNEKSDSLEITYFEAFKYGDVNEEAKPRTSDQPLFIGATPEEDTLYGNMDGFMDELRISNVVRSFSMPPIIKNVTKLDNQRPNRAYEIQAEVHSLGDQQIRSTELHYRLDKGSWQTKTMAEAADHFYETTIPSQELGTTVAYYISAETDHGLRSTHPEGAEADSSFYTFGVWRDSTSVLELDFDGLDDGQVPVDQSIYETDVTFKGGSPTYTDGEGGPDDQALVLNASDSTWLEIRSPFHALTNLSIEFKFYASDSIPAEGTHLLAKGSSDDLFDLYRSNYRVAIDSGGVFRPDFYAPDNTLDPCGAYTDRCLVMNGENDQGIEANTWYEVHMGIRDTLGPQGLEQTPGTVFAHLVNANSGETVGRQIHRVDAGAEKSSASLKIGGVGDAEVAPYFNGRIDDISITNYLRHWCVQPPCPLSEDSPEELPEKVTLSQNYPNPFNPTTQIEFQLPQATEIELVVYDVLGRRVAMLVDGKRQAGKHSVTFNASNLSSGVYVYRLKADDFSKTRKMLLVK